METTYRLIALEDPTAVGRTASSPELAKLVPGELVNMRSMRLGIERTDWVDHFDKKRVARTILIDAESTPAQWKLGI